MSRYALPLALTLLGLALALPFAALAEDPHAPYEGRPLPELVRRLLWDKACDIPQAEAEGELCSGDLCGFRRSNGLRFRPQRPAWMVLTMFQWAAGSNALGPALIEGKLGTDQDIGGDARVALALASGLAVDVKTEDQLVQLNPMLVRWVGKELLPPADRPLCGKTAKDFYQAAFSGPTRLMVDVYARLKARGALRGVTPDELAHDFDSKKGRYASMCQAIARRTRTQDERWPRAASCWWWLRRAASGGTDELALLFGKVLRAYDPDGYRTYGKSLPKEPTPR